MPLRPSSPCVGCGTLRYPNKDGRPVLCQLCRRVRNEARLKERLENPQWTRLKFRDVPCRQCGILRRTNAAYYTCEFCKVKKANKAARDKSRRKNAHSLSPYDRDDGICCVCLQRIDRKISPPHPGAYFIVRFPAPAAAAHLRCAKEVFNGRSEAS